MENLSGKKQVKNTLEFSPSIEFKTKNKKIN